ncbi:hypothetical protein Tco_0732441 [Tanacetum coccineum]
MLSKRVLLLVPPAYRIVPKSKVGNGESTLCKAGYLLEKPVSLGDIGEVLGAGVIVSLLRGKDLTSAIAFGVGCGLSNGVIFKGTECEERMLREVTLIICQFSSKKNPFCITV